MLPWNTLLASGWLLFAEGADAVKEGAETANDAPGFDFPWQLFAIMGILFYFIVLRPKRTEQKKYHAQMSTMAKNSRVVTIGGIHGVVTKVDQENKVAVVRIDEGSGATMRVGIEAIARIVVDEKDENKKKASSGK